MWRATCEVLSPPPHDVTSTAEHCVSESHQVQDFITASELAVVSVLCMFCILLLIDVLCVDIRRVVSLTDVHLRDDPLFSSLLKYLYFSQKIY